MTCPNIYLGTGRFGAGPLAAEYGNDSIVLSSYNVTQGDPVGGQVVVRNRGTSDSPPTHVELYWSDPATNFAAVTSQRIINELAATIIGTAAGSPDDETTTFNFNNYAFPTVGHWCLLARLSNNNQLGTCPLQQYNSSSPPTDPQSAIHNINVIAPGGGGGGGAMGFAFAAMNMQRDVEKTFLEVHALDPAKDREKLMRLVALPGVDRALARRQVKFALPNAVLLGEGRERIQYRPEHFKAEGAACAPRLRVVGEVTPKKIAHLLQPGAKLAEAKGKHELDLRFAEGRQTFIQVEPCGKEHVAYAVEIAHKAQDGRDIGGLVCIFVPPHNYF
jgi:hypothetical protein